MSILTNLKSEYPFECAYHIWFGTNLGLLKVKMMPEISPEAPGSPDLTVYIYNTNSLNSELILSLHIKHDSIYTTKNER